MEQILPMAGDNGIPAELLSLSTDELERRLNGQHTQENPYIFLMPNAIHKVAVYPDETLGKYDLEFTAHEFMTFIAIGSETKMEAYCTRDGQWHCLKHLSKESKASITSLKNEANMIKK